jgi:hypothetical protein
MQISECRFQIGFRLDCQSNRLFNLQIQVCNLQSEISNLQFMIPEWAVQDSNL